MNKRYALLKHEGSDYRWVSQMAMTLARSLPSFILLEDLIQSGMVGLLEAKLAFDQTKEIKFTTFAQQRVRGAMIDDLRRLDWAPRSLRRQQRLITETFSQLQATSFEPIRWSLVAKALHMTLKDLDHVRTQIDRTQSVALDDMSVPSVEKNLIDHEVHHNPCQQLERNERLWQLRKAIESLPYEDRRLIRLQYFKGMRQHELAKQLKISPSRVSQLHLKSLAALRSAL